MALTLFTSRLKRVTLEFRAAAGIVDLLEDINGPSAGFRYTEPGFIPTKRPNLFIVRWHPNDEPRPTLDTLLNRNYPTIPAELPFSDTEDQVDFPWSDYIEKCVITLTVYPTPTLTIKTTFPHTHPDEYEYEVIVVTGDNRRRYYILAKFIRRDAWAAAAWAWAVNYYNCSSYSIKMKYLASAAVKDIYRFKKTVTINETL